MQGRLYQTIQTMQGKIATGGTLGLFVQARYFMCKALIYGFAHKVPRCQKGPILPKKSQGHFH
jgi:hypothetical protein